MPRCPNCYYELVLLEHRLKFKCAKCGRVFPQHQIEVNEFQQFNKRERKVDKEKMDGKPQKQAKLSEFEKKQRAKECQRKYRENNRDEYNLKKREYWASNKNYLLAKRRQNYRRKKDNILAKQSLWRQNNKIERKINNLRFQQKALALQILENNLNTAYSYQLQEVLPSLELSYVLSKKKDL